MEFIDYMIWKAVIFVVGAFVLGLLGFFRR